MNDHCPHDEENCYYYLSDCREDGWRCIGCSEELGFRPDLDRSLIDSKVEGLLMELTEKSFIYVSNSTEGSIIVDAVVERCRELGYYDQWTILRLLLEHVTEGTHAEFWRGESQKILHPGPRSAG